MPIHHNFDHLFIALHPLCFIHVTCQSPNDSQVVFAGLVDSDAEYPSTCLIPATLNALHLQMKKPRLKEIK